MYINTKGLVKIYTKNELCHNNVNKIPRQIILGCIKNVKRRKMKMKVKVACMKSMPEKVFS